MRTGISKHQMHRICCVCDSFKAQLYECYTLSVCILSLQEFSLRSCFNFYIKIYTKLLAWRRDAPVVYGMVENFK